MRILEKGKGHVILPKTVQTEHTRLRNTVEIFLLKRISLWYSFRFNCQGSFLNDISEIHAANTQFQTLIYIFNKTFSKTGDNILYRFL